MYFLKVFLCKLKSRESYIKVFEIFGVNFVQREWQGSGVFRLTYRNPAFSVASYEQAAVLLMCTFDIFVRDLEAVAMQRICRSFSTVVPNLWVVRKRAFFSFYRRAVLVRRSGALCGCHRKPLEHPLLTSVFSVLSDLWKRLQAKACLLQWDLHREGELRIQLPNHGELPRHPATQCPSLLPEGLSCLSHLESW